MRNFITAKILKVESPIKYKNKKSEEGTMLKALIADETASAKCIAYDPKMFPLFKQDECIVLHDIIKKKQTGKHLVKHKNQFLNFINLFITFLCM